MKGLYKFHWDCGRMGDVEGVFVADSEDVSYMIDNNVEVYFGEILGKHSEVSGCIDKEDITFITSEENVIDIVEQYGLESGYNPLDYFDIEEHRINNEDEYTEHDMLEDEMFHPND